MERALIFSIQKFCIHDGPGIRTTIFFKGCPLACQWCHNPESQSYGREIMVNPDRCTLCGRCQIHCSQQAIQLLNNKMIYHADHCRYCEKCVDYCSNNAREVAGQEYTVSRLMAEIEKDRPFYEQSGGGVTLSGGEAMIQIDFVEELIRACKERGISVAMDTSGYAPWQHFTRISKLVDLFLYDIKLMDSQLHRQYTGKDNGLILENLQALSDQGASINLRLPLIDGVNSTDIHINQVLNFISTLHLDSINLLPYHDIGKGKYDQLNRAYGFEQFFTPSAERLSEIETKFTQANYKVNIGG
jgi:pyruvate formate lyase activating enzyme